MSKDVNSFRPRYANGCGQFSREDEARTGDEEMSKCSHWTSRGGRRERASKEWSRYLGDPLRRGTQSKDCAGINNRIVCCSGSRKGQ
jgi:hypothetical protein